ncbi:hypothetical protein [Jannaschia formosa]|uniref:hypothetical protein n=1 Tax=Jannaschia formosa TaxID=2259592 RepID=UPI000E1B5AED|nr:hypothetical protein [Jannaschia formosa]TFL19199.1 hypothetical protein DR046_04525 [Jannaschia formosa]
MTETLTLPTRTETVEFDRDVLSALCDEHGAGIESFLTGCLLQIGQAMERAMLSLRLGDTDALDATCVDLGRLADLIGMRTVATAARAVRAAIAAGDATALAACGTRLVRLGHPSAVESWTVRTGISA